MQYFYYSERESVVKVNMLAEEERLEETERDVKWALITSIIMYFISSYMSFLFLGLGFSFGPFTSKVGYYLANVNTLFFILTITSSVICKARFWKTELTYKLTMFFFIFSMALLFIQDLRWLFFL